MDYSAAFQISASGMAIEKLRLDTTANNLANMHNAASSAAKVYQAKRVLGREIPLDFSRQYENIHAITQGGVEVLGVEPLQSAPKLVYDPNHPYADTKGFVAYPAVNHAAEMVNLNIALRAYEANVVAMNAAKTMAARTLEIGGNQS